MELILIQRLSMLPNVSVLQDSNSPFLFSTSLHLCQPEDSAEEPESSGYFQARGLASRDDSLRMRSSATLSQEI